MNGLIQKAMLPRTREIDMRSNRARRGGSAFPGVILLGVEHRAGDIPVEKDESGNDLPRNYLQIDYKELTVKWTENAATVWWIESIPRDMCVGLILIPFKPHHVSPI